MEQNKMGVLPVNKLLITMSLPMVLSMLMQALYNVVDSVFVAQLSEDALTAVTLAFPVQNFMISIGSGTAIGVNALLSRHLGAREFEHASSAAKNGIFLAAVSAVCFAILGITLTAPFVRTQTHDAEILAYGISYLKICTTFSAGIFLQMMCERLLISTGKTMLSMLTQITGAVINIILDPILIFGLLGAPRMGIAGAAVATVAGQWIAAACALILNVFKNREINISPRAFRPEPHMISRIYAIGIPSIIMISISSVMTFCMNRILMATGSGKTAVAVFGVYFKLQSFVFMPVFGLNNGMVPIVAYNFGAGSRTRMVKTIKYAVIYAVSIMLAGFAVFQLFPNTLLGFFNASAAMERIGIPALRIMSLSFIVAGACIVLSSVFQALGHGVASMSVSVVRQLIFLIPSAYLLSLTHRTELIWFAFPIAEAASIILCTTLYIYLYRTVISRVEPIEEALRNA